MSLEVRKTVTVLFCDMVDSTGIGERLDPEPLRQLQGLWFGEAEAALTGHGGTVEKFIGDAVMAVFGVPEAHEDDALRALRAAYELSTRIADLNPTLEARFGERVVLRTGITTGEVYAGGDGIDRALVTGDVVVEAKRLEEAAPHGGILVGAVTRSLVAGSTRLEPCGRVGAKGKREGVEAWRVDGLDPDGLGVLRRPDAPLVGRGDELATLFGAFEDAAAERRCIVMTVLGAPGIGKSRLAREFASSLAGRATVLTGRCVQYGNGATWWPLTEMLRDAGGEDGIAVALAHDSERSAVAERLRAVSGHDDPGFTGDEIFWAVRRLVEALGAELPVVIGVDDAHWAEPMFHDLVEYLAGFVTGKPVLVLRLARPELARLRPLPASWRALELDALTPEESRSLLDAVGAPAARRDGIVDTAEGNPLFLEQLAAVALNDPDGDLGTPPSIDAVLAARLDQLDPLERETLACASVLGRRFELRHVADLLPDGARVQVGATLLSLLRTGLVRPAPSRGEDGFRFAHGLIRDAAYARIPKVERANLHERVALRAAADPTGTDEYVGYHLEQAAAALTAVGDSSDRPRRLAGEAATRLLTAGNRALERDDVSAAANLLDRTAHLLEEGDDRRLQAMGDRALALWECGRGAEADTALRRLVDEAERVGAARRAALARLELVVHGQLARTDSQTVIDAATDAIELCRADHDDVGLARALRRLSSAHRREGRCAAGEAAAREALGFARAAGSRQEEARAADGLCNCLLYGPTPVDDALATCRDLAERRDGGSRSLEANALGAIAGLAAIAGDFHESADAYARASAILEELGLWLPRAALTQVGAPALLLAGDPVAAEREARRGAELLEGIGSASVQAPLVADALAAQGRYAEAAEQLAAAPAESGPALPQWQVRWELVASRIALAEGRSEEAVAAARTAVVRADETDDLALRGDAWLVLAEVMGPADGAEATQEASRAYGLKGHRVGLARALELTGAPG